MRIFGQFLIIFLISCFDLLGQNPLINYPSLNFDGSKMAFNFQGDIWISDIHGNAVKRLTTHKAYDTRPLWSVDGKSIGFQSNRNGNYDIYTIPSNGGVSKRLTYFSSNDYITDYSSEGEILFNTERDFNQIEWEPEVQTVNENGGTPYVKLSAFGYDATISPNKKFILFVKGPCRIQREAYKGSANKDIWLYNIDKDQYSQLTTFSGNDFNPKWAGNNTIYYLSAKSGRYNVHQMGISDSGLKSSADKKITSFEDMGIFSFDISGDGSKIVLIKGDELFLVDTKTNKQTQVNLNLSVDYQLDPIAHKTYSGDIKEVVPSPNSKYSSFVIRGEIFLTKNDKEKSKTINLTNHPYRDRDIDWLSNESIVFISDREGQNELYLLKSSDSDEKDLFKSLKREVIQITKTSENESNPKVSPDGKKICFQRGRGQLIVANLSSSGVLSNEKTLLDGWDTPSGIAWSPDSKWIAYSLSDLEFNEEVYIQKVDNTGKPVNISMHPKKDIDPVWSDDGSKLAFSSKRNNGDYDVWFVWLKTDDWQKTKQDWDELDDEKKSDKDKDKEEDESLVKPVVIDLEGIYKRQVQVTSFAGGEFVQSISKDGETFVYSTGNGGNTNVKVESDLFKIKWNGKDKKALTTGDTKPRSIVSDKAAKYIYYTSKGGKLNRVALKDEKKEKLPISASMNIDYYEESNQIFEEAWNAINEGFYDPDFHGQNWVELKEKYKPLAMKASTRNDFKSIFNWMLGQVNASHMGMYRGEERSDLPKNKTGLIGATLIPVKSGGVKVVSTTYNMPSERNVSQLNEGDVIVSVNGVNIESSHNFYKLLDNKSDEKIYLGVKSTKGVVREVVIRPKSSNSKEKYEEWVNEKKRLTDLYSNGELGYIHIQGMNWSSFEQFERELTGAGYGKKGVVIDVRFNGGGWTTDYLMAVLNVKQHAYTVPRGAADDLNKDQSKFANYYPYNERLPLSAWTKPSIAICNESSYSNAEIFSHAYKNLGIGSLVGVPTFGAVISTGARGLIDGSIVRMPFRGWYAKQTGIDMEYEPAIPDFIVKNNPDSKLKKVDLQLKKAVEQLLIEIK